MTLAVGDPYTFGAKRKRTGRVVALTSTTVTVDYNGVNVQVNREHGPCAECGVPGRYTLPGTDGDVTLCASHRGLAPKFGAS